MWLLIKSLHENATTAVKWNNELSKEITIKQGIRQGAKLSTVLYKRFNNEILKDIEEANIGTYIGNENVTSPTCADDLALLHRETTNLQALTTIVHNKTCKDRFTINPSKSELVCIKNSKRTTATIGDVNITMGEGQIKQVTETKHLGIERNESNTPNTQERIKTARKTVYSLLGAGLHGCNGISPIISFNMWTTYVTPRMLHGIEMLHIRKKDANDLEMYQRKTLKQFQGLPQNCATADCISATGSYTSRRTNRHETFEYLWKYTTKPRIFGIQIS
ncbi:hypothetical protein FSP39_018158 [Pinctada imbricata]|uniref:Reverse transcriptase domain-containing protein n=1 Tax=Pinctada imbricata TaxID=66713 RepID=A0AA89CBZ9_PINIB|nr:hypothetical protein FSP39_018158 [Pinctada imbricata]